ncbi:BspA family leucine-rich repeat surface protein [Marivirga salinae]|uniref:BspA family leucine-rich repeat surface protein n=1 Tax=Marivirga salinarum TaxID=3059078 RepID=A0AA51NB45_9BACT|nr:BspA family leucine-rich repeat surface protein [Marivirga sp. BDSF4-3]WMN11888.1 BspA family leucine-rich repeat surface protein [Marivirga sp. BDSF4-3]
MKKSLFIACLLFMSLVCNNSAFAQTPTITSISPSSAALGTNITIIGAGFNASGPNDIFFGSVKVTANANAAGTEVVVKVPAGASSVTPLVVRNNATTLQTSSLKSTTPYFTITHTPALPITTASFTETRYDVGGFLSVVASGDFDNDGYVDMATGSGTSVVNIYLNNGLGGFSFTTALPLTGASGAGGISVGDMDGDGNLDLVVAKSGTGNLDLFKGNGDGSFSVLSSIAGVTGGTGGIIMEDFNNDGYLDLISNSYSTLYVHIGDGSGTFTTSAPRSLAPVSNPGGGFQSADINKDGYLDLIIPGGNGTNSVLVLLNNQDETFGSTLLYPTGNSAFRVAVGDYNGNGNVDLAVLSYLSENITVLEGDGTGDFTPFTGSPINVPGTILGLSQGDFDGDGIIDLAIGGNTTNSVPLLKGDGLGGFASFPTFPYSVPSGQPKSILSSDFNNDGVADISFSGTNGFHVMLSPPSFRTTWITTDSEITIPTQGTGYNYDVFWNNLTNPGVGDGLITGQTGNYTITGLANGDTYQVRIRGDFPRIYFNNGTEKDKIRTIEEWGSIVWGPILTDSFYGCSNLISNATDTPDLSSVTNMTTFFRNATSFNSDISQWDLSNVNFMSGMFSGASAFNNGGQPLTWGSRVSNIVTMSGVFENATTFNQNINDWDVSSVQNMSQMFLAASNFNNANQPLIWTTNGGTVNVNNMINMFLNASNFNQDIGSWDVSSVQNMNGMLTGSGLSSVNYEATLEGWSSQTLQTSVQLDAIGKIYCSPSAITARANIISTYGWTINDGGVCEPTSQANTIVASNIGALKADISWTNGNGTSRIVVAREGSAVTTNPSDLTTYAANANFGSGTELGSGNYVVYNGIGNNFTVNNLNPGSVYHFRVYEYNGTASDENYNLSTGTVNPAAASTLILPEITDISPQSAPIGTLITISGSGFNPSGPNDIFFGPLLVTANANAAGTEVLVNIPAGASSVTPVVVRNNANGLQASSISSSTPLFNITVAGGLPVTTTRYRTTEYATTFQSYAIATGDFDNDGDVDIITADRTNFNDIIQLQVNDGNGVFTNGTSIPLIEGSVMNLQVGDLDGDGNLDIAAGKTTTSPLELFKGNGDGTFTAFPSQPFFSTVTSGGTGLAIADMNKDGNMDIITANALDAVSVLLGDGAGNFAHASYSPFVPSGLGNHTDLKVANFNNDGFLDIVLLDDQNEQAHILLFNSVTELFDTPISFTTAVNPFRVVVGNFDSDANVDLAILNIATPVVEIYSGDGAGNFSASGSPVSIDTTPLGMVSGDFDGDGITDLLLGGGTRTTFPLLQGNGTGGVSSFSTFPMNVSPSQPYGVISADFNNDGYADLAGANRTSNSFTVSLYIKPVITSFAPTYADIGETITIIGEDFTGVTAVNIGGTPAESFTFVSDTEITAAVAAGSSSGAVEVTTPDGTAILDGFMLNPFVTTWVTDNGGIIIPTTGGGYNYDVTWSNLTNPGTGEGSLSGRTGNTSIFGLAIGDEYEVRISGVFPRINFQSSTFQNQGKIRSNEQWGNNPWTSMEGAFSSCRNMVINAPDSPDLSSVTNLSSMFVGVRDENAFTNTDLTVWDVSTITDMSYMFNFAWYFNQNINNWNVSNVTNMAFMFGGTYYYNQPLNDWDVSNVINMELMFFELLLFNQPLDQWDVSNVQFMNGMFSYTSVFNQPLESWDVSSVTNMQEMFGGAEAFNQPLNGWDVSSVTNMSLMFEYNDGLGYNQPLDNWDVSNVTEMWRMFTFNPNFNQDISGWDVSNVTDMWQMFRQATAFNQNLGTWDVGNVTDMGSMLDNSGLSAANYDATLIGWSNLPSLQSSISLGALNLNYCTASTERQILTNAPNNWTITGDNEACDTPSEATDIIFSNTGLNQTEVSWTNGDGSNRIVIAKAGSMVDATPVDLNTYAANASFGTAGTEIGIANFVVYKGNGNNVIVTNLNQGETYHFQVFEYNGPSGLEAYNTDPAASGNPASVTTFLPPSFTSFSPPSAAEGEIVTLMGDNFTGATSVIFGGTPATFTVVSDSEITATVGLGSSGNVEVSTPGGTVNLSGFTFIPAPVISSFTPVSAAAGETVIIQGTNLTNASAIVIAGVNVTNFAVNTDSQIAAEVPAGGSTSGISVTTPGGTVSSTGFNYVATPEIDIFEGASNLATNATLNFEDILEGTSSSKILTIDNPGVDDLLISDIQLTDGTAFTIYGITLPTTIAAGTSADFTLTFSSAVVQSWNDVVSISSNDSDENPFNLNLEGTIIPTPVPEIEVSNASVNLASNDVISFSELFQNDASDQVITITNSGTADLVVSAIELTTGTAFTVSGITLPATIVAGTSADFTLTFSSSVVQGWNDVLSISSNDSNENPFILNLEGTVIPTPVPEIEVSNASVSLASNDVISFADLVQNESSDQVITITNSGTADLVVSAIELTNGTAFAISGIALPVTIAAGTSTDFTLTFSSAVVQSWNDVLSISSNDSDEDPFILNVTGTIIPLPTPQIEVRQQSELINGVVQFGTVDENSDASLTFEILNLGTAPLAINAIKSSSDKFSSSGINLPVSIIADESASFDLILSTSQVGNFESTISISSNDPNQEVFSFNVRAIVSGGRAVIIITNPDNSTDRIVISDEDVDLGQTNFNLNIVRLFGIENLSDTEELIIEDITTNNPLFTISEIPKLIQPGEVEQFSLTLNSKKVGLNRTTITVTSSINDFSFNVIAEVISEEEPQLVTYNLVTPNGDGKHDFLFIENINLYPNNNVSIFNRLGNKVFEISNYDNTTQIFEGISSNGQELITGNYYYVIDKGDGSQRISGFLLIKR